MSEWGNVPGNGDIYSQHELDYARSSKAKTPSAKRLKKEDAANTSLAARGKTEKITRQPMTDSEKMTICMLRGKGLTEEEIGEKLSRAQGTVSTVLRRAEEQAKAAGLNYDWREDLREKSVVALRQALISGEDVYKGGTLALGTLKGLGDFEGEGATVNIQALINGVPEHLRSRYISSEPVIEITETQKGGSLAQPAETVVTQE